MASAFGRRSRARSVSPGVEHEPDELKGENYLRDLTSPESPSIDIVAVHGLNSGKENHGERTWMKNGVLWLRDAPFLPQKFPTARIMLLGYNSRVAFSTSIAGVMDVAIALLNRLKSKRVDCPDRPIIFLCHSLGGIIVKQALVRAVHGRTYSLIRASTKAICFFGTPHRGGNRPDLGSILASMIGIMIGSAKNNFMRTLQKDSTIAADIHELFKEQILDYQIVSFYETLPLKPGLGLIVDKVSATLSFPDSNEIIVPLAGNHSEICKFDTKDDTYELIIANIAKVVQHALQPPRSNAPLLTPMISVEDPENRRRTLSVSSVNGIANLDLESLIEQNPTVSQNFQPYLTTSSPFAEVTVLQRVLHPRKEASPKRRIAMIPYSSNPDFIVRDRVLENVKKSLALTSPGHKRRSLYGLGGVGKSQVAIRYAYWYRQALTNHSIFWIHCGTAERLRQGLIEVGIECKVPGMEDPNNNRLLLLKDWLTRRSDLHWLMVLDNADDLHIFHDANTVDGGSHSPLDLRQYIPDCEHGAVLITTRDLAVGRRLSNDRTPIQIPKMPREESILMLRTRLGTKDAFSPTTPATPKSYSQRINDDDLGRLANTLDDLPLAMAQAAAFIIENSISAGRYMELFEDDSSAVQLLKHNFEESGRDSEVPNSVYATWKLSIEQIQESNPKSAELIFLMAHYEQLQIPVSLLKQYIDSSPVEFTTIIGVLLRFSLINSGRNNTYSMHRLVQLIVKQWLAASKSSNEWQSKALQLLAQAFPSGDFETWVTCAALDAHVVKVLQAAYTKSEDKSNVARLQANLSWYYFTRGRWNSAEKHARASTISFQEVYGTKSRDTLTTKTKFAHILKQNSKLEEAEIVAKQAADESKANLGSKDQQYLNALDIYATVVQSRGKLDVAERACRKALSGREKVLGLNHPDVSRSTRRLAAILEDAGRYEEAETFIRKALSGQKHLIGTADKLTLQITYRLASILRVQGKLAEAEETGRENLETQTSAYGFHHTETQPWEELARALGAQHPLTLTSALRVSEALAEKMEVPRAVQLARQVVRGREKMLNAGHPDTVVARQWLAALEQRRGSDTAKHDKDLSRSELGSSTKINKKRRSFLGLRSRAPSRAADPEQSSGSPRDEDEEKKAATSKVEREKELLENDFKRPKRSPIWGMLGLSRSESKEIEDEKDLELDTDDDSPVGGLDPEKSAAYTTSSRAVSTIDSHARSENVETSTRKQPDLSVSPPEPFGMPLWGQLDPQEAALVASDHQIKRRPVGASYNSTYGGDISKPRDTTGSRAESS